MCVRRERHIRVEPADEDLDGGGHRLPSQAFVWGGVTAPDLTLAPVRKDTTGDSGSSYRETLWVPASCWLAGAGAVVTVWVTTDAAGGTGLAALATLVTGLAIIAGLWAYGRGRLEVSRAGLRAGPARLPLWAVGTVTPLDAAATRAVAGPQADPRAFLELRSYARTSVRVEVDDEADPTPYWLVSTRHPDELTAALLAAKAEAG